MTAPIRVLRMIPGSTVPALAPARAAPARALDPDLRELIRRMAEADVDRLWREAEEAQAHGRRKDAHSTTPRA